MPILLSRRYESSSYDIEDTDDNNNRTKAIYWEYETYRMFDESFEDCLNSNVFTVKGYNMGKYVIEHLDVILDASNMTIKSQLDVLNFIYQHTISLNSTSSIETENMKIPIPEWGGFQRMSSKLNLLQLQIFLKNVYIRTYLYII